MKEEISRMAVNTQYRFSKVFHLVKIFWYEKIIARGFANSKQCGYNNEVESY